LFTHLSPGLSSGLFTSTVPTNTCPAHLISLFSILFNIYFQHDYKYLYKMNIWDIWRRNLQININKSVLNVNLNKRNTYVGGGEVRDLDREARLFYNVIPLNIHGKWK
jgi:hypothetical protein